MYVITIQRLLMIICNFLIRARPKDCEIKFIDSNGIAVNGIEKIVIEVKRYD
jgi:hypothetical protein